MILAAEYHLLQSPRDRPEDLYPLRSWPIELRNVTAFTPSPAAFRPRPRQFFWSASAGGVDSRRVQRRPKRVLAILPQEGQPARRDHPAPADSALGLEEVSLGREEGSLGPEEFTLGRGEGPGFAGRTAGAMMGEKLARFATAMIAEMISNRLIATYISTSCLVFIWTPSPSELR